MPKPSPLVTEAEALPIEAAMVALYDHYFACHDYEKRYPQPNAATLQFLLTHGARQATQILDFGCGNGRYALALLQATEDAQDQHGHPTVVTGYDISEAALTEFDNHLKPSRYAARAHLLHGPLSVLHGTGPYDMALLLFGVLSHVGVHAARIAALRQLHAVMAPQGTLVLTVPSAWRRRPWELLRAAWVRRTGQAQGAQAEVGNILFTRVLGGTPHQFFYHLYTVKRLRAELLEAGFVMTTASAESLLPEWLITQHPWLGRADALLSRALPAALGYGIRAVARSV